MYNLHFGAKTRPDPIDGSHTHTPTLRGLMTIKELFRTLAVCPLKWETWDFRSIILVSNRVSQL
jgi:hypothetical protein